MACSMKKTAQLLNCRELDAASDRRVRMQAALRGVFAGNIFDLGANTSSALFDSADGVHAPGALPPEAQV